MGNYCCIASKQKQHLKTKKKTSGSSSSMRQIQKGGGGYVDEHDYDIFDEISKTKHTNNQTCSAKHQMHKKKSSLYSTTSQDNAGVNNKKGVKLFNSNGVDSQSCLLLLHSSSTSATSSSTAIATLDASSVTVNTVSNVNNRRGGDNSQIINHFNSKSMRPLHSSQNISQFQQTSLAAAKFNQCLIDSPLIQQQQSQNQVNNSSECTKKIAVEQQRPIDLLYNINENEEDMAANRSSSLCNVTTSPPPSASTSSTAQSRQLLLTKSVNSKKLCMRKRTSYLNQSLNETDRDLMKNYHYVGGRLLDNQKTEQLEDEEDEEEDALPSVPTTNITSTTTATMSKATTAEALNLFNWKNYRSLQKSKRSIKNLEETIQSSRSIEQWLNDFSKLKLFGGEKKKKETKQLSLNGINKIVEASSYQTTQQTKRKLSIQQNKTKKSRSSLDELNEEEEATCIPVNDVATNNIINITDTSEKLLSQQQQQSETTTIPTEQTSSPKYDYVDPDEQEFKLIMSHLQHQYKQESLSLNTFLNEIESRNNKSNSGGQKWWKLIDSISLKQAVNYSCNEKEMIVKLNQFLLPRSLANSEDIDLLKWLLSEPNFRLKLVSLNNQLTYSNDHLVYETQINTDYLLIANQLNIKLTDQINEQQIIANDQQLNSYVDDLITKLDCSSFNLLQTDCNLSYVSYDSSNGSLRLNKQLIEKLLSKEKEIVTKMSQLNANAGLLLQETGTLLSSSSSSSSSSASAESLQSKQQHQLNIIEKYRKFILETSNFRGAQILMNIKKKQILNRKSNHITPSSVTVTSIAPIKKAHIVSKQSKKSKPTLNITKSTPPSIHNQRYLDVTPAPLVCTPISNVTNSSGTTSPSSSSVSPISCSLSSSSSSSYQENERGLTNSNDTPAASSSSILLMTTPCSPTNHQIVDDLSIQYADLNERLFSCLLSNFSCQLVNQFLTTQSIHTGFIRKHKHNKSFTFVNITNNTLMNASATAAASAELDDLMNESSNSTNSANERVNRLDLSVEKQCIQLCLKLNEWPSNYQSNYFKRKRINQKWPAKSILEFLNAHTCLITAASFSDTHWHLETKLAELYLFKSLSPFKQFQYFYLHNIFMNITIHLSTNTRHSLETKWQNKSCKFCFFQLMNERIFTHHYFRFVELEQANCNETGIETPNQCFIQLVQLVKRFSNYLRFILEKYATFNAPNYFDLNLPILTEHDYSVLINKHINTASPSATSNLANCLYNLIMSDLNESIDQFDLILDKSLILKLNTKKSSSLNFNINLFNNFLDSIQLKIQQTDGWIPEINSSKFCLIPAHYSADTYLDEYVYEFVAALYEQFKSKRDNFQISEHLMLELHDSILAARKQFDDIDSRGTDDNHFLNAIQHLSRDSLFDKFEEYAECVHKYLPQIRHNNQYLLFHYIWTMQVQYMAPFFNYLCDFYPIID